MPTTLRNTDILFNDGTTQSTAAGAPASIGAIGSVVFVTYTGTTNQLPGATVDGSLVRIPTTVNLYQYNYFLTENTSTNTRPFTTWTPGNFLALRRTQGNTGFTLPVGQTTQSGTWRLLTPATARSGTYSSYGDITDSQCAIVLAVRIA